jgi:GTP cyclohydrolase I
MHRTVGGLDGDFRLMAQTIIDKHGTGPFKIYGVPRGGVAVAYGLCHALQRKEVDAMPVGHAGDADIIVDDVIDSGATMERHKGKPFYALVDKRRSPDASWEVFPWEDSIEGSAGDIVTRLLQFIGEDPTREGLRETPSRFLRACGEWFAGYRQDPADVFKVFEDGAEGCQELVIVNNIPIFSFCEHHIAPIIGVAHVGYIPKGKIVGISKLARLTEIFGRRMQVQERLTNQIADAIVEHLAPIGVGVLIRAKHLCMASRGVKMPDSLTTTSAMRGALMDEPAARAEFLALCRDAEGGKHG